jgi:hypothetical protein
MTSSMPSILLLTLSRLQHLSRYLSSPPSSSWEGPSLNKGTSSYLPKQDNPPREAFFDFNIPKSGPAVVIFRSLASVDHDSNDNDHNDSAVSKLGEKQSKH